MMNGVPNIEAFLHAALVIGAGGVHLKGEGISCLGFFGALYGVVIQEFRYETAATRKRSAGFSVTNVVFVSCTVVLLETEN